MMKSIYFVAMTLAILSFSNCSKDDVNQPAVDKERILQYLADQNIDAIEHESGLFYTIEEEGSGGHPNSNSEVLVKYKGYLLDGSVFDETGDDAITFFLYNVITGWRIGIPLYQKGGKGKLFIPSHLGYGSFDRTGIPANSVLIFEVELLNFQ